MESETKQAALSADAWSEGLIFSNNICDKEKQRETTALSLFGAALAVRVRGWLAGPKWRPFGDNLDPKQTSRG